VTDRSDTNDPFSGIQPYEELSRLSGDEPLPPLEDPGTPPAMPPRSPLLTGLVLGLLLVVVSIALFQLLSGDDGDTTAGGPTPTDQSTPPSDTTPDDGSATSLPSDGSPTTTAPQPTAPPYVASGEPVPVSELLLAVDGVGPIKFGEPAAAAVGRLIASLGDPDSDTGPQVSTGAWGVCEGDTERIVQWGPFAAIVVVDPDGTETFAGYRLDFSLGGFSSEAADLETLSGLAAGASLRQLEQIYADFDVQTADDPEIGPIWLLNSTNTGNLLLWGPLTADETVRGIYAPDACGRF
jgi:hypothetical protein